LYHNFYFFSGVGYAIGYYVVKSFMKKNNITIQEATLLNEEEIIAGCGVFLGDHLKFEVKRRRKYVLRRLIL